MRLPGSLTTPRLSLRRWVRTDAAALSAAVETSLDHLRPWMAWAADEPLSPEARLALLGRFESEWESGGDVVYGAFRGGMVVGGCGLTRRPGPTSLEIGYWVAVDQLGRGYAGEMARALTDAAFTVDGIEHVEIHHDRANVRSRAVAASLGFLYEGECPDTVRAPAEEGIDCTWTMTRPVWLGRGSAGR